MDSFQKWGSNFKSAQNYQKGLEKYEVPGL